MLRCANIQLKEMSTVLLDCNLIIKICSNLDHWIKDGGLTDYTQHLQMRL